LYEREKSSIAELAARRVFNDGSLNWPVHFDGWRRGKFQREQEKFQREQECPREKELARGLLLRRIVRGITMGAVRWARSTIPKPN
jgi:hypothetical protein